MGSHQVWSGALQRRLGRRGTTQAEVLSREEVVWATNHAKVLSKGLPLRNASAWRAAGTNRRPVSSLDSSQGAHNTRRLSPKPGGERGLRLHGWLPVFRWQLQRVPQSEPTTAQLGWGLLQVRRKLSWENSDLKRCLSRMGIAPQSSHDFCLC